MRFVRRQKNKKQARKTAVKVVGGYARRIHLVGFFLGLFLVFCLGKVGFLQLVKGRELLQEVREQVQETIPFFAKRGKLLDRNGNVLAMSFETKGIEVHKPDLEYPEYVIDYVSGLLAIDRESARKKVLCKASYCYVTRFVDPKMAEPLERILRYTGDDRQLRWQRERLAGVRIVKAAGRVYPFGETAGQVVGIARVPRHRKGEPLPTPMELEGQYGVEAACDDILEGKKVLQKGLKRQRQGLSFFADNPELILEGKSVVLTLDVNVQKIAEEELQRSVITSLARRGMAVVMDVPTGELLAVAHYPPFNPNGTASYTGEELWKWNDAAFIEMFEPGSILKPLIVAAALEEGVITMDDLIFCENGSWKIERKEKPIKDHARYGFLTVWDIIKFSSNIGSGKIGLRLGTETLYTYLKKYGFGERTGAKPRKHEARGLINKGGRGWSDMEIANISFGQGIAVTAIQMVGAIAALGNQGKRMQPLLVKEVLDATGKTVSRAQPEVVEQVVSPRAAQLALEAMRRVLEPGGTGENATVYGFDAAGKTGTAQKTMTIVDPNFVPEDDEDRPDRRGVYVDKWIGSFVGLVPSDAPRLAILVVIDEPYMNDFGGIVAAPAFSRIASRTLAYQNVIPSREIRHTDGDRSENHEPRATDRDEAVEAGSHTPPRNVGPAAVPDFTGMTVRECLEVAYQSRLSLSASGGGVAVRQEPAPSEVVDEWTAVNVVFERAPEAAKDPADGAEEAPTAQ